MSFIELERAVQGSQTSFITEPFHKTRKVLENKLGLPFLSNWFDFRCEHDYDFEGTMPFHLLNNRLPIVYSNHQSHIDGYAMAKIAQRIISVDKLLSLGNERRLNGFYYPVAATLLNGKQNTKMTERFNAIFTPLFSRNGIETVPVVTDNDITQRGETGDNSEAVNILFSMQKKRFGLLIHPEGSVQGGRTKPDGSIFGMKEIEDKYSFARTLTILYLKYKQPLVFIPVGTHGSYHLFSPERDTPTEKRFGKVDLTKGRARVSIGEPFTFETLVMVIGKNVGIPVKDYNSYQHALKFVRQHPDVLTYYLMKKVAGLLPQEARGFYA